MGGNDYGKKNILGHFSQHLGQQLRCVKRVRGVKEPKPVIISRLWAGLMQPFKASCQATVSSRQRNLACALVCDHKLAIPAGALAARIARLWSVDVHIFVERPTNARGPITETNAPGVFYHYEELFVGGLQDLLPDHPRFSRATWGRLFVPAVLCDYKRILYCDIDVLPGPLPLGIDDIELLHGIGMARDLYEFRVGEWKSRAYEKLNPIFRKVETYFNSGVMLVDPKKWSVKEITCSLRKFISGDGVSAPYPDQDFLNTHFDGKVTELSPNLNFQQPIMGLGLEGETIPAIRHFCHGVKPFHRIPSSGVSELVKAAAVEFREMAVEAELFLPDLTPYDQGMRFKQIKATIRGALYKAGIHTPKERKLEADWHERRRRALDYLRIGYDESRFADARVFDVNSPTPRVRFNGFEILPTFE